MSSKKHIVPKNKFNNNLFLMIFLVLIILFILIFSSINFYDSYKKKAIEDEYNILQQQLILNDIYRIYISENQQNKCAILKNQLESYLKVNEDLFLKLKKINKNAIVESDNKIKHLFILTNINLWFHYQTIEKECNNVDGKAILYFYPEFNEFSVEKAKSDAKTLIFADALKKLGTKCNFNSIALPYINYIPILDQLIVDYDIKQAPAAYINGKAYYDINFTKDFLEEIGCN